MMRTFLFALSLCFFQSAGILLEDVSREVYLMGTKCSLIVFSENRAKSLDQLEQFIRILEKAEKELSTWQEGSMLTALNHQPIGEPINAEPNLCNLISELKYWTNETGGAFDPGIGALIKAWGIRSAGRLPSELEIGDALAHSGMSRYVLEPQRCRITRTTDVVIDCGAFGKGEALDRIRSSDSGNNSRWLVNLGGQVAVKGIPPGTDGWEIRLAHPGHRDKSVLNIFLTSGSLATSGGSERDLVISGSKISHLLDPRSGKPIHLAGSVSVWHESALIADILSTALYIMGADEGSRWAESRGLAACYLLDEQGSIKLKATRAFRVHFMDEQSHCKERSFYLPAHHVRMSSAA